MISKAEKVDRTKVGNSVSIVSKREHSDVKKGGELFMDMKKAAQMFRFTENPDNADACRKILHQFAERILFNEPVVIPEDFAETFFEESVKDKLASGKSVSVSELLVSKKVKLLNEKQLIRATAFLQRYNKEAETQICNVRATNMNHETREVSVLYSRELVSGNNMPNSIITTNMEARIDFADVL